MKVYSFFLIKNVLLFDFLHGLSDFSFLIGHRIGKGEGFGDLEFAVLAETGAVTENTVIVTTVHDCQVN